jgi:hypothetical protein
VKKLVFVGISLFGVSIIFGDLCAARKRSTNKRPNVLQVDSKKTTGRSAQRNQTQQIIKFSDIKIETNALDFLKSVISGISSKDLKSLNRNMLFLSRDLEGNEDDSEVKEVISIMNSARKCFEKLRQQKEDLYQKLFGKEEEEEKLSKHVDLGSVDSQLSSVDLKKLESIIEVCKKKPSLQGTVSDWEAFSKKLKQAQTALSEMKKKLSTMVLNQIEGLPELKNLSKADTDYNKNLEKQRKKKKPQKLDNESPNQQSSTPAQPASNNQQPSTSTQPASSNQQSSTPARPDSNNQQSSTPTKPDSNNQQPSTPAQPDSNNQQSIIPAQPAEDEQSDDPAQSTTDEQPNNSEQPVEDEQFSNSEQPVEDEQINTPESSNTSEIENTENSGKIPNTNNNKLLDSLKEKTLAEFYEYLGDNLESIDEDSAKNKEKNKLFKLKKDLEEAKSDRSFEQKISDVKRITKSYNRIVTSSLKTKEGKKLISVPRDVIKSLQQAIYLEVFDDLSSRLEKLHNNEALEGTKIKEQVRETLNKNEKNKKDFIKSEEGKEKRRIMTDSVESYDQLMDDLFQQQIKIKDRNSIDYAKLGYSLETVILSIDV